MGKLHLYLASLATTGIDTTSFNDADPFAREEVGEVGDVGLGRLYAQLSICCFDAASFLFVSSRVVQGSI